MFLFLLLAFTRQALDHPYLVIHGPSRDEAAALAASSQGSSDVCGVCQLNVLSAKDCAVATCRHAFHRECIVEYIEEHKEELLDTTTTTASGAHGNRKNSGGKNGSSATAKNGKAKSPGAAGSTCGCPVCFQPLTLTLAIRGAEDSDDDDDDVGSRGATPSSLSSQGKRKRATPSSSSSSSSSATKPALSGAAAAVTVTSSLSSTTPVTPAPTGGERGAAECRACCERPRDACYLPCGHIVLCMECTGKLQSKICPLCRAKISRVVKAKDAPPSAIASAAMVTSTSDADSSSSSSSSSSSKAVSVTVGRETILQRLNMAEWQSSTKVEAVANAIVAMVRDDASDKGIIFSQYRTMLDLVEWRLKQIPGKSQWMQSVGLSLRMFFFKMACNVPN